MLCLEFSHDQFRESIIIFDVKNMREIKFNQFAQTTITRYSNDFVDIIDNENRFRENVDYVNIQNKLDVF